MGLKIFFGKFSSGVIFKPMNYFSLLETFLYVMPMIVVCILVIYEQKGYRTKVFYSSVETIVVEILWVVSWVIGWRRGEND